LKAILDERIQPNSKTLRRYLKDRKEARPVLNQTRKNKTFRGKKIGESQS